MERQLNLYTAAQSRALDRIAIEQYGLPGIVLMKRAGRAAWQALRERWPEAKTLTVFCGGGNNGGDGYIVAALAAQQKRPVRIVCLAPPEQLTGDAALACQFARDAGVAMQGFDDGLVLEGGVIVDALLGTGSRGAPRGDYAAAIDRINASGLPVLALDLPSGLDADTGHAAAACIRATATITFIALKRGLLTGRAPALTGELLYDDLQLPADVFAGIAPAARRIAEQLPNHLLPPRAADAHKGHFGHVLVIGGDLGMGGAAAMAAEAAARTGAGLVSVATRAENVPAIVTRRPELMARGIQSAIELEGLLARASVVAIGPGLGKSEWSQHLLAATLASSLPLVVDADALNLIADMPDALPREWVLTPHPGEAARLLRCSTGEIQADRFAAAERLQQRFGGTVVLKGAGSLVASAGTGGCEIAVCSAGNPGMASGGMGDVLSGVIAGLIAQGLDPADAAELGVLLHARAADRAAAASGERGMLASDLFPHLQGLVNPR